MADNELRTATALDGTTGNELHGTDIIPITKTASSSGLFKTTLATIKAFVLAGGTSALPPGGATGYVLTKLSGADDDADWAAPTGGGGGGSGTPPTLRGVKATTGNANNIHAALPSGSVLGDLAIVAVNSGYDVNSVANSTDIDTRFFAGASTNGRCFMKVLDATDISNGYIAITFTGSFNCCAGVAVFDPATVGAIVAVDSGRSASSTGSASRVLFNIDTGCTAILYGGARGNGAVTLSASDGSDGATSTDASLKIGYYTPTGIALSESFTFAADGFGNYSVAVIVRGV